MRLPEHEGQEQVLNMGRLAFTHWEAETDPSVEGWAKYTLTVYESRGTIYEAAEAHQPMCVYRYPSGALVVKLRQGDTLEETVIFYNRRIGSDIQSEAARFEAALWLRNLVTCTFGEPYIQGAEPAAAEALRADARYLAANLPAVEASPLPKRIGKAGEAGGS